MADVPIPPEPFRFHDPSQDRLHRRLLRIGENAAAFYRDVHRVLGGAAQLETGAHAVAQNLREIESAVRRVLLPFATPAAISEAKKRHPLGKTTHLVEVAAILHTLGLEGIPAAAETWRRIAAADGEASLARLAHRDALGRPRPLSESLFQLVSDVEAFLDTVLGVFETRFLGCFTRLDQLLEKAVPSEADITALRNEIPNNPATLGYFFDRLAHPGWLIPLREAGFFNHPPDPVPHEGGGRAFPWWPATRYLARMAAVRDAQRLVLEIALDIPQTDNVRVYEDLADVALALPPALAEQLAGTAGAWITSPYNLLLPEKLGDLVTHLARGGRGDAALGLACALLEVRRDPRQPMTDPDGVVLPLEAWAHFDLWRYEQILKENIPDLVAAAGVEAFRRLCDVLEAAVRLSRPPGREGPEDYSYIWRPSIEDHGQNRVHALRGALVSAVRDAAKHLGRRTPASIPAIIRLLEDRPWRVFHRLALHLLRVFPDEAGQLAEQRLTDPERFQTIGLQREYRQLLRDRFTGLSPEGRAMILGWIEAGPDVEEMRAGLERTRGKPPTDEEVEGFARAWRVDHLAVLVPVLTGEWRRKYDAWRGDAPEPEQPDFPVYSSGWHGSQSPKSAAELGAMTVDEIVAFLHAWAPTGGWREPSRDGLEAALTAAVKADPAPFAAQAACFKGVESGYVTALLWGLRETIKERPGWEWGHVLELCGWAARETNATALTGDGIALDRPARGMRKAVASLVQEGFAPGPGEIPFSLRAEVWHVLEILIDDSDPGPGDEVGLDGENRAAAASLAINTVRGDAMHGVVRYALWVRRHIESVPDGKRRVARGFDEMPEVRAGLEAHLDPGREPSLAVRSVYGQWYPWLVLLDQGWAAAHVNAILPGDASLRAHRDVAWNTYVIFCDPYDSVFDLLRAQYRSAVDALGTRDSKRSDPENPEEQLAQHLMTLYARGKLSLDEPDGLLATFFGRASVSLRRHALASIGTDLRETAQPLAPAVRERLATLWAHRLRALRAAPGSREQVHELEAFGWWFASGAFDEPWSTEQLAEVLSIAGRVDAHHEVMQHLADISGNLPGPAAVCAQLMVEGDVDGWVVLGAGTQIRTIVSNALDNPGARQAGMDLVNVLAAHGHPEFRDLIK